MGDLFWIYGIGGAVWLLAFSLTALTAYRFDMPDVARTSSRIALASPLWPLLLVFLTVTALVMGLVFLVKTATAPREPVELEARLEKAMRDQRILMRELKKYRQAAKDPPKLPEIDTWI